MSDSPSSASRPPSALVGQIAGEYKLGRVLGEGGFGTVYEAEHPVLKRRAAVKVLHRVAAKDSDALLRFVSEAQAVNQIRSRHIVDIFSFGKLSDGRHFYVMDLLDGEPLDRHLKRVGKVDVSTALQILRPIAEALDVAHAAGIVHRDLKPQNVFLSWESTGEVVPKLLDFGVAKLLGDSAVKTVSGTPIGTPLYMSPEQARGDKVDARSDVYALGVLTHELITGDRPITADSTLGILMAHIVQTPTRASSANPALPLALDEPILRMLEKSPDARPHTAGEAMGAIANAAEQSGLALAQGLPRLARPLATYDDDDDVGHSSTLAEGFHDSHVSDIDPSERLLRTSGSPGTGQGRSGVRWKYLGAGVGCALVVVGAVLFSVLRAGEPEPVGPVMQAGTHARAGALHPAATAPESSAHATATTSAAAPDAAVPSDASTPLQPRDRGAVQQGGLSEPTRGAVPSAAPEGDEPATGRKPSAKRKTRPGASHNRGIPSDLESPF